MNKLRFSNLFHQPNRCPYLKIISLPRIIMLKLFFFSHNCLCETLMTTKSYVNSSSYCLIEIFNQFDWHECLKNLMEVPQKDLNGLWEWKFSSRFMISIVSVCMCVFSSFGPDWINSLSSYWICEKFLRNYGDVIVVLVSHHLVYEYSRLIIFGFF